MHMSDALVSPPVFLLTGAVSLGLLAVAIRKVSHPKAGGSPSQGEDEHLVPRMGVMGAFVFAAQMINFSIPGTGSSGHLVGGILLSAVLGPWAALITLSSVLLLQCLVFADGGFMALGCNILNMAVLSCLVAYPLLFRPVVRHRPTPGRILAASLLASVGALAMGAVAVTLETEASGITALPLGRFLLFMLPIHLLIGTGEGLATAAVIGAVWKYRPCLLADLRERPDRGRKTGRALAVIAAAALVLAGSFSWLASSNPDGLEWSIEQVTGQPEVETAADGLHLAAASVQQSTALMPDYDTSLSGIIGCGVILLAALGGSYLFRAGRKEV